jgi:hypothetical protein
MKILNDFVKDFKEIHAILSKISLIIPFFFVKRETIPFYEL